jgi:hypothetical protein
MTTTDARAALAAALHAGKIDAECGPEQGDDCIYAHENNAAAILAAMPGWRLVPADAETEFERGKEFAILHARLVHGCDHGTPAVPVDAERLSPCGLCGSTDRWLHYYGCGRYYGGTYLAPAPSKPD